MDTPRVFVSMGSPYTDAYRQFRNELETFLRDQCHVDPRIIGRNEYPTGSPLHKIAEVMRTCDGVMIVAYERKLVHSGVERRGGTEERKIEEEVYTTPWNHIESALGFSLGLPLYFIAQRGLTEEGLIESKVEWYVQKIDFTVESLRQPEVVESIKTWIRDRVALHQHERRRLLKGFSQLRFPDLTIQEWIYLFGLMTASFGVGAAAHRLLPNIFG
jgi:hypothetical protein